MYASFIRALVFALALFPAIASAQVGITFFPGPGMPAASSVAFGLSFVTKNSNGTGAASYTYAAQSLGVADATRQIAIESCARQTGGGTLSTVTVQGISATQVVQAVGSGVEADIWVASVPTGTTGDVVVTYTIANTRNEIAIYRIVGTGAAFTSQGTDTTDLTTPTKTFAGSSGGGMIATACSTAAATSATISNMTQDVGELVAASTTLFQAGSNTSHAGTSTTYSWTYNNAQGGSAAAWASISP